VLQKQGTFFVYVGLGSQTVVFKREVAQVSGTDSSAPLTPVKRHFKPLILGKTSANDADEMLKKIDEEVKIETMQLNHELEVNVRNAMDELETPKNIIGGDDAIISMQDPAIQTMENKKTKNKDTALKHQV